VKHPAKFSPVIIAEIKRLLDIHWTRDGWLLDPFGGLGGIHALRYDDPERGFKTIAVEIEPEWAEYSGRFGLTICADWLAVDWTRYPEFNVTAVATSPTYGNRMADHHEAKDPSVRNTYRHTLGRPLARNNSGAMQWGPEYKLFHRLAWKKVYDILPDGGVFILNCKDHIRKHEVQEVTAWHIGTIVRLGFECLEVREVAARGNRQGENGEVRIAHEWVIAFKKTRKL
jgi:hypothetical protein